MGSLPIEPEDYALNANALIEQQRRVLEAQHRVIPSATPPGSGVSRFLLLPSEEIGGGGFGGDGEGCCEGGDGRVGRDGGADRWWLGVEPKDFLLGAQLFVLSFACNPRTHHLISAVSPALPPASEAAGPYRLISKGRGPPAFSDCDLTIGRLEERSGRSGAGVANSRTPPFKSAPREKKASSDRGWWVGRQGRPRRRTCLRMRSWKPCARSVSPTLPSLACIIVTPSGGFVSLGPVHGMCLLPSLPSQEHSPEVPSE